MKNGSILSLAHKYDLQKNVTTNYLQTKTNSESMEACIISNITQ